MVCRVKALAWIIAGFAGVLMPPSALAASPSTTQASGDVDSVTVKIDPGATGITGQVTDQLGKDVFGTLGQLADVKFLYPNKDFWNDPQRGGAKFSASWDREPFWEAAAETCDAIGVRIEPATGNIAPVRVHIGPKACPLPMSLSGAAMIRAEGLSRSSEHSYWQRTAHADEMITLTLQLFVEPKLGRATWVRPPIIDSATDDRGHAMATTRPADDPKGELYKPWLRHHAFLNYPADAGEHIAVIKGHISMLAVKELGQFTFHHPMNLTGPLSVAVGPNQLILKDFVADPNGGYHCDLSLMRGEKVPADQWAATEYPLGSFYSYVAVIGPDGAKMFRSGHSHWSANEMDCELRFSAKDVEKAAGLRVDLPVSFGPVEAKFEFKDLPMP